MLMFTLGVSAQNKNFLDTPYLETNAVVDTLVVPDEIYITITIKEKDSKGKISVETQEQKMAKALASLGINVKKQLSLKYLDSNFKNYFLKSNQILKSKTFTLLVYDGLTAAKALASLENIGIANSYLEKTAYSKMAVLEMHLKTKAVKKALQKAKALTKPLGQQVGMALHISDQSQPVYRYAETMAMSRDQSPQLEAAPLDVNFNKIKVRSSVNVKFALGPKN